MPPELRAGFTEGLTRLGDLGGAWIAPPLAPVTLFEHTQRLEEVGAVREALVRFAARPGCRGWLETPQAVLALRDGQALPGNGTPMHAELACGAEGLQLRCVDGAWLITRQHEGHPDGHACWVMDVERLANLSGIERWRYRVYLQATPDGTLRPFAARLAGADS